MCDAEVGDWKSSGPRFSAHNNGSSPIRCLAISRNNSYMLSANGGKVRARRLPNWTIS